MKHGCLAGEYKKSKEDVYQKRIIRSDKKAYSLYQLGAYAQDLTAIAAFFPEGWKQPVSSGLSEANQGWLLQAASFCLMSLGRLAEAIVPRQATLKLRKKLEDWLNAARTAQNLVDLLLLTGQLTEAKQAAQQAIEFAERIDDQFQQVISNSYLATVLHRQGDLAAALEQFELTEKIQHEWKPDCLWLYSLRGGQYCALLLDLATDTAAHEKVLERGQYALKISMKNNWLMDIALDYLTIARALFALNRFEEAREEFEQAVAGIRKAGTIDHLPEFLLERAKFHRHQKDFTSCQTDLDEAQEIIDRCGMELYAVDAALLRGNLNLDLNKPAQTEYEIAKELIDKTGYHLRDGELEELGKRLGG